MSDQLAKVADNRSAIIESVVAVGDLAKLTPQQRVTYYQATCESLGLNPLTRPFEYIRLNNRLTLYARRQCTDQLRRIHKISLRIPARDLIEGIYVVTARATTPDGREDESTGAVSIKGLAGNNLANAYMKAETKAKRRVTLSIVGLGWLDETEIRAIPDAQPVAVNSETGEIMNQDSAPSRPYPPETVKAGVLSRAAKGTQVIAEHGFRGLVIGYLEAVWLTETPDVRAANRHSVLNYLFGAPSSKKLTTGQCKGLLEWLTDEQPDTTPVLNAYAVAEANAIVNLWNEKAGQQRLQIPDEADDEPEPEDLPF